MDLRKSSWLKQQGRCSIKSLALGAPLLRSALRRVADTVCFAIRADLTICANKRNLPNGRPVTISVLRAQPRWLPCLCFLLARVVGRVVILLIPELLFVVDVCQIAFSDAWFTY